MNGFRAAWRRMGRIHLNRNRQPLGQFSPEEVADGLKTGEFLPTDLAWQEPMEAWKPLAEFTDLPEPAPMLVPPPMPAFEPTAPAGPAEPAWERREGMTILKALTETVVQIATAPSKVFSMLKQDESMRNPLLYFFLLWTTCTWIGGIYQIILTTINPEFVFGSNVPTKINPVQFMMIAMAFVPFFSLVIPFILSGIFHLSLMIVAGGEKAFPATFRVFCYAWGTAAILKLIPVGGVFFCLIAAMIVTVIGMQKAHAVDFPRAAISSVAPIVLLCGGLILLASTPSYLAALK